MKKNLLTLLLCVACAAISYGQDKRPVSPPVEPVPPETQIFTVVEGQPEPPFNMSDYISRNMYYPDSAIKHHIQGRVLVQFVVNEDGSISDAKVLKGIGYGCDEEALRVLKMMPPWKPGKQNGKPVKVYFTQPISFKL